MEKMMMISNNDNKKAGYDNDEDDKIFPSKVFANIVCYREECKKVPETRQNCTEEYVTTCVDNPVEECITIPLQFTRVDAREIEATECATKVNLVRD